MKIAEFDIFFLSYDEPNAELNYADLCNKVPWAQRVHGVKGSDAAHKAAANLSTTDWFVTVDADNIVNNDFFNLDINIDDPQIQVYSWVGRNVINNLMYGNGGLKLWKKDFVLSMRTHEASESPRAQVDFCWEDGYKQFTQCYSDVYINGSPYQAWRAGFREGVKMTLLDGVKIPSNEIQEKIWWHNIHRLQQWSTIGSHVKNGIYAVYGARLGTWLTNCTDWDYTEVRDFDILKSIWNQYGKPYEEVGGDGLEEAIKSLGEKIKLEIGFDWPYLDFSLSQYVCNLYSQTIKFTKTYYRDKENV